MRSVRTFAHDSKRAWAARQLAVANSRSIWSRPAASLATEVRGSAEETQTPRAFAEAGQDLEDRRFVVGYHRSDEDHYAVAQVERVRQVGVSCHVKRPQRAPTAPALP
jgi:hypothetical protein